MAAPLLRLRGRAGSARRFPVWLALAQDPIRGLRQMPRHCPDGFGMVLALANPPVELSNMSPRPMRPMPANHVGGFSVRTYLRALRCQAFPRAPRPFVDSQTTNRVNNVKDVPTVITSPYPPQHPTSSEDLTSPV